MRDSGRIGVAFAGAMVALLLSGCGGGKVSSFSAEQVHSDASGAERSVVKFFMSGENIRTETKAPRGDMAMVTIYRADLKKMWILNPAEKKYFEKELTEAELKQVMPDFEKDETIEELGKEKLNGYACRKLAVETTISVMGFTRKSRSTVWQCDQFDIPLRVEGQDGSVTVLRNIQKGRQAGDLFECPDDYERAGNMLALFAPDRGEEAGKTGLPSDIPEKAKSLLKSIGIGGE